MPCMLSPCHSDAPVACPHTIALSFIAAHFNKLIVHHTLLNPLCSLAVLLVRLYVPECQPC